MSKSASPSGETIHETVLQQFPLATVIWSRGTMRWALGKERQVADVDWVFSNANPPISTGPGSRSVASPFISDWRMSWLHA